MLEKTLPHTIFSLLLLMASGQVLAESVYVIDVLRVGIRATPTGSGASETVVKSGDKLEVLEKGEKYFRVRAADGTEGWVNKGYLSETPTAALRIVALERENDQLRREIDSLKAARGDEGKQINALQQQLATEQEKQVVLAKEREALQGRIDTLTAGKEGVFARYRWAFELAVALLLLGVGLYYGRCSYRCRLKRRFGGMEI